MPARPLPPLLLALAMLPSLGCVTDEPHTLVPSTASPAEPHHAAGAAPVVTVAATQASAARVAEVGRKVLDANPQIGIRPAFSTIGAGQTEVFHRSPSNESASGPLRGSQLYISEALARDCATDGQLAAVLAYELGRMVAERESLVGEAGRRPDPVPPPDVRVGNDYGGTFGPADGTRMNELARLDRLRRHKGDAPPAPADPDTLARRYLERAGYRAADLDEVRPLLEKAERCNTLEQTVPR